MRGQPINYSSIELEWIKANKEVPRRQLHADFVVKFGRHDVSFTNLKALCKRKGWLTGRTGRFPKGHKPANKGKKMPYNANSARTQFKKGQVPPNQKPLGHERINKYGYVEISVAETNPYTGHPRRFVAKHRWLWEKANGPIPKGHTLKCLDGDKTNTDPSNWDAIPNAVKLRLNGRWSPNYDDAPDELKPAILATAKLDHASREARRRVKK